jgi:hypothetical protein
MGEKASERKRGTIEGLEGTEGDARTLGVLWHVAASGLPCCPVSTLASPPSKASSRGQRRSGATRWLSMILLELQGRGAKAVLVLLTGRRVEEGRERSVRK